MIGWLSGPTTIVIAAMKMKIRPMVTESPTETMNSTVPAEIPPNKMLAKLLAKSTDPQALPTEKGKWRMVARCYSLLRDSSSLFLGSARADRLRFALALHLIDLRERRGEADMRAVHCQHDDVA